ncbi:MAG TPA: 3,4-dehydroadipyl-CoA semialdehyde dehydrogenase [Myxococcales bacterium]|nr:3,4-dehydroadipyl-CoA semialdehyde dehydrogenase [Myxococcales bacterium]
MQTLRSFLEGKWVEGKDPSATLVDPSTEEALAKTSSAGLDFGAAVEFARKQGGPALRELSFAQRGALLKAWSKALYEKRDELIQLAMKNGGNTRGDAKFDVDGAIGTLAHYGELGVGLGDLKALRDGEAVQLGRTARYAGIHLWVPRDGVTVHINAFNFPAWGTAEKAACAFLAGMPIISKPATSTALVAFRLAEIGATVLPAGTFSFVCGSPGDLLDKLGPQDVVAFTGSSRTAAMLRDQLGKRGAKLNVEADSLNAAVLGPDVEVGGSTWDLFIQDAVRDITQKTGQKCTAIRRIFVAQAQLAAVQEALTERLAAIRVGDTSRPDVTMGPLSTADQLRDVRAGIQKLASESTAVFGGDGSVKADAPEGKGYFVSPVLFVSKDPAAAKVLHKDEVFGPVATLAASDTPAELVQRGGGGLVCSIYSDDRDFLRGCVLAVAPYHGRIYLGSEKVAGQTLGPGAVLPQLLHGGPGHAGGGEELGGLRGMQLYSQRVAIQGDRALLDAIAPEKKP